MAETTNAKQRAGLMDTIEKAEHATLGAVQNFLDTVNDAFPDLGTDDDGPRRRIIDAAFSMTTQLVNASNRLVENVLDLTEDLGADSKRAGDVGGTAKS